MLSQKQIYKLAQKIYPSSSYSRDEIKSLRDSITADMQEYVKEHPHITYESLQEHFCDDESLYNQHESARKKTLKFYILFGVLIIAICLVLYFISNTWTPPTYSFT